MQKKTKHLKILGKVCTVLTASVLTFTTAAPGMSLAIAEIQDNLTTEANVSFDAKFGDAYQTEANLGENVNLDLKLKVENTGYVKDVNVLLDGENFKVAEGDLELEEANAGEEKVSSVKVTLPKTEKVKKEAFTGTSKVKLNATYVNAEGNEKQIEKELQTHVTWISNPELNTEFSLARFLTYKEGDKTKTMITFKVKDGVKDNLVPLESKELKLILPKIDEKDPEKVIVLGSEDYVMENGTLTVKLENKPDENGYYAWDSQTETEITLIYDADAEEKVFETGLELKANTLDGKELETRFEKETFELEQDVGSIVEVTSNAGSLSKGQMYANLNREEKYKTEYIQKYDLRVGYAEIVDSIVFEEVKESDLIKNQKITINPDNLKFILGEDGFVNVKDYSGNVLGTITKSRTELLVKDNKLFTFETSKPKTEGILTVSIAKELNQDALNVFDEDDIDELEKLETVTSLKVLKDGNEISSVENTEERLFEEPTSNASMTMSTKTLSTQSVNEDVVFNVVLKTNDFNDRLYKNPNVKITLPGDVTEINVKQAQILYTEELKPEDIEISNNEILLKLAGTQTEYTKSATSVGPVLRVVADISLNNLIPSKDEKVIVTYSNAETEEVKELVEDIRIVAPEGFITTNTIKVNGTEETSLTDNRQIEVSKSGNSKVTLSQLIVNNEEDVTGLSIVGRIPSAGNKTLEGYELGSNVDTELLGSIDVEGLDADVLYSTNANEEVDGAWTTDSTNAKSYKISAKDVVAKGTIINTSYSVALPDTLESGAIARSIYGVYYNNNAEEGTHSSLAQAQAVGVYTEETPDLSLEVVAYDTNDGHTIGNNQEVKVGTYMTYQITVTNNGGYDVTGVGLKVSLPIDMAFVTNERMTEYKYDYYTVGDDGESKDIVVGTLKAHENKKIYVDVLADNELTEDYSTTSILLTANKLSDPITKEINHKMVAGKFAAKLTSAVKESLVALNQKLEFKVNVGKFTTENLENVDVTINLPEEVEYVEGSSNVELEYNKSKRTLKYRMDKFIAGKEILFKVNVVKKSNNKLNIQATVTDGTDTVKSNTLSYQNIDEDTAFEIKHYKNVSNDEIYDNQNFEVNIEIKNKTSEKARLRLRETISEDLGMEQYKVITPAETYTKNSNDIDEYFDLGADEKVIITCYFSPVTREKDLKQSYVLAPRLEMIAENDNTIYISSPQVRFKIIGTDAQGETTDKTSHAISGEVWFDANEDGKKAKDEKRIEGVRLILYDNSTGGVAKDEDGKDLVVTSDSSTGYMFKKVTPGQYTIIAEYKDTMYNITEYKVTGSSSSEDSDFVEATFNGEKVAASNTVLVSKANIYNLDLGLIEKNDFDLKLTQKVKKVTITNPKNETRVYEFDSDIVKVELSNQNLDSNTVTIDYELVVTNKGKISGYAKKIMNTLAAGFDIPLNLNDGWYVKSGKAYNELLANTEIKPGESKSIPLTLIYKSTGENVGTYRNTAEIVETFNAQGIENRKSSNTASSAITFMISSGLETVVITGVVLAILIITAGGIVIIKKYVIKEVK